MEYHEIEQALKKTAKESLHMLERGELSPRGFCIAANYIKKAAYFCGVTEKDFFKYYPKNICGRCAETSVKLTDFYELADRKMDLLLYDRVERPLLSDNEIWHTRLCPKCMREKLIQGRTIPREIGRMKEYLSRYEAHKAAGEKTAGLMSYVDELEKCHTKEESGCTDSEELMSAVQFLVPYILKLTKSIQKTAELLETQEEYIQRLEAAGE